jgi:acyl-coenzyme A synthetase/AMP-(fatty) acid ligase
MELPETMDALFGAQPEHTPFITGGATRGRVRELAERTAGLLAPFDSKRVCLYTESKELMAATLAASMAGEVEIILPHSMAPETLEEALCCTGERIVVTDRESIPLEGLTPVRPLEEKDTHFSPGKIDTGRRFLHLFTGGSTGSARIWSKTPANILSEILFQASFLGLDENDIIIPSVPPYHIYGLLFTVFLPLLAGCQVQGDVLTYPGEILRAARDKKGTLLVATPSIYRLLNRSRPEMPGLRRALSSAAPLPEEDSRAFYRATGVPVTEILGSTETGGIAWRSQHPGDEAFRAFDCIDWDIRDERLRLRSPFLSPDLPVDREGYFTSNDRVEPIPGSPGQFRLLGRSDSIVKVAGKRVDLAELEEKIREIEGVKDCRVVMVTSRNRDEREPACAVESKLSLAEARDRINRALPGGPRIRRICIVEKIPLLPTGKTDRERLLELLDEESEGERT